MFNNIFCWISNLFSKQSEQKSYEDIQTDAHVIEQTHIELEEDENVDNAEEQLPDSEDDIVLQKQSDDVTIFAVSRLKYFTVKELCQSVTATIKKIDNTPTQEIKNHLEELIVNLLDPIREAWAEYCTARGWSVKGITVTSGYRCPKLNKAVGGATSSAHLLGYAADTKPSNGKQNAYEQFIREWVSKNKSVKFDQVIIEKSSTARWVHIGFKNASGKQRMQCFNLNV